jgi:hypothetical protein
MPRPPYVYPACFPQEKIFQDGLSFASGERRLTNFAFYFQLDRLGAHFSLGDVVERKAARAAEKH